MPVDIKDFPYLVRIQWTTRRPWNDICIHAIEKYGLPGGKYTTLPTTDYMDFYFKDDKDAMWFRLTCE